MSKEKNKYQAVVILKTTQSYDEGVESVKKEIEAEGIKILETDVIGSRQFAYISQKSASGYYVRYVFESTNDELEKIKSRLKINPLIHSQHYFIVS